MHMFASPLPSTSAAARAELAAFLLDQKSREGEEDEDSDNETAKWSCDAMRKKIATFLASKEMTQTAFLKECGGIAPNSYGNFMKLKGAWNGTQNGTFWGAQRFFLRRDAEKRAEAAMMPTAEKKRKRVDQADDKTAKKTQLAELLQKVRALPGPEKARPCHPPFCAKNCPGTAVYDTCDEVRKKSLGFMAASGMTQSAFIKEIGSHPPSWNSFIKMKGKFEGHNPGAGNGCYWGAYDFLEKVRIVRGEKKSARRLAAEAKHPPREMFCVHGGYRLKNDDGKRWVFTGR